MEESGEVGVEGSEEGSYPCARGVGEVRDWLDGREDIKVCVRKGADDEDERAGEGDLVFFSVQDSSKDANMSAALSASPRELEGSESDPFPEFLSEECSFVELRLLVKL